MSLAEAGDVAGAIEAHEAALARDPSLAQAHANLVGLYGRLHETGPRPRSTTARPLARGFDDAELHYDYGVVLGMQEKWDAAADALQKGAERRIRCTRTRRNNLGQILERAARFRRGCEPNTARRSRPADIPPRALQPRTDAAGSRRHADQAIVEFEKLQQPVDAETPRYLFALSTALVRAGRIADGRAGRRPRRSAWPPSFGQTELARRHRSGSWRS